MPIQLNSKITAPIRLPAGKTAAVLFSVDDAHPASKARHGYEAGGDLEQGALRHLLWLFNRHPSLKATLFLTADWRAKSAFPTRKILKRIPFLRNYFYLISTRRKGELALYNHPDFTAFLSKTPNFELATHGLHHCHKGLRPPVEFQNETVPRMIAKLRKMLAIFDRAGLSYVKGICPPAWEASDSFLTALSELDFLFVSSARDLFTPISPAAVTNMSGRKGLPVIYPAFLCDGRLLHIPINYSRTSEIGRAFDIIRYNGVLSIKAHIIKRTANHVALDGLDEEYRDVLDGLFTQLEKKYGDSLWWTSFGEFARLQKETIN